MIIITGGAGFIGSAVAAALNERGIRDILIVDELASDEKWKNLRNVNFTDYVEKKDFLDMVWDNEVPGRVEAIFHMGACSDTTETNASYLVKNNYEYSKFLAQWADDCRIRLIYASSAATYGDGALGFDDHEGKIRGLQPLNVYGYSKHMFDLWLVRTGLSSKVAGLKYFNVFGPNEYHKGEMRSFVLKAFEQINATGKVKLFKSHNPDYADGEYLRDFLYIKDAVDMTLFFFDNPRAAGIFNIGTGTACTWNSLARAVFDAMGKTPDIEYMEMPESIRAQYQYHTEANIAKLRRAGYDKKTTRLETAVTDYVQNYLQKGAYLGVPQ